MKFTKVNISEIPIEDAHGGSGSRQILVKPEHVTTPFLEAVTKGYLPVGKQFDWHTHKDTDEIFIVLKGQGKFYTEHESVDYKKGDVITTPGNMNHKIEALGSEDSEYYFIRIKAK